MTKRAGILFALCCFFIAALPNAAPAAQSLSRQSLIENTIAGLQDRLLAGASDDTTPLHGLTVQFLDDLIRSGFKRNTADLDLALMQYVAAMHEQTTAAALDPVCSQALLLSITTYGSAMLQELAGPDAPVCKAISLSTSSASIIAAKYDYDICVIDNTEPVDEVAREALVEKQRGLKVYAFAADVLNLAICTPAPSVQDLVNLIVKFIALVADNAPTQ